MKTHSWSFDKIGCSIKNVAFSNTYDFSAMHRHTYYEIFLIENARGGEHVIDFESYSLANKTLYIVAPNQAHLFRRQKTDGGIVLQFTTEYLHLHASAPGLLFSLKENSCTKLSDSDFENLQHSFLYLEKLEKDLNPFREEKFQYFFAFTIVQIIEIVQRATTRASIDSLSFQFLKLAENKLITNRNIASHAQELGVSLSKLNAQIRTTFGKTPLQMVHELLILEIKRLIVIEQLSHKEISYYLHFDSQSSYSRFVSKHMQCKPSELSQRLKNHK